MLHTRTWTKRTLTKKIQRKQFAGHNPGPNPRDTRGNPLAPYERSGSENPSNRKPNRVCVEGGRRGKATEATFLRNVTQAKVGRRKL